MRRDSIVEPRRTGAYISRLRKEKDWTQQDLAERLFVTNQAVSRWELGDSFPDITILPRLAQLFGVSIDELLNGLERADPLSILIQRDDELLTIEMRP